MCVIVWIWTKRQEADFGFSSASFRQTLELSNDVVRGAVARQLSSTCGSFADSKAIERSSDTSDWNAVGRAFFREVWPIEPSLQSPTTAKEFARIPARVALNEFGEAVHIVLPYLMPFEIWDVQSTLWLDVKEPKPQKIVHQHPSDLLTLLSTIVGDQQSHGIFGLKALLDLLISEHPKYAADMRLRTLRKLARSVD